MNSAETRWRRQAICCQTDPEAFYPNPGGDTMDAKTTCLHCPVRDHCFMHAITHNEQWGIWGGLTETERRPYRHRPPLITPPVICFHGHHLAVVGLEPNSRGGHACRQCQRNLARARQRRALSLTR